MKMKTYHYENTENITKTNMPDDASNQMVYLYHYTSCLSI